jgi:hypothetical protein
VTTFPDDPVSDEIFETTANGNNLFVAFGTDGIVPFQAAELSGARIASFYYHQNNVAISSFSSEFDAGELHGFIPVPDPQQSDSCDSAQGVGGDFNGTRNNGRPLLGYRKSGVWRFCQSELPVYGSGRNAKPDQQLRVHSGFDRCARSLRTLTMRVVHELPANHEKAAPERERLFTI